LIELNSEETNIQENADWQSEGDAKQGKHYLTRAINGGQIDPFQTYPASKMPNVDILLKHCK
jgi:hypothetical protein